MIKYLWLVLALVACGRHEVSTPKQTPEQTATARVVEHLDSDGFVVSYDASHVPAHLGDSLLWTGLAAGLLPCTDAVRPVGGLLAMLQRDSGRLTRHPTNGSESDDGKFGVYWGLKRYFARCKFDRETWVAAIQQHRTTVGTALHPMIDDVLSSVGARQPVMDATRRVVGDTVRVWVATDVTARSAAYRVHLAFLILDQMGDDTGKQQFCVEAAPAEMQLPEAFCGNPAPLRQFVDNWQPNVWEYALQRSPVWESDPDGNGDNTPGLDLLMAQDFLSR